jgi:hypothetical protein
MDPALHIALHEGFSGDTVTVKVNGKEVQRLEAAKTDYRIGVAHAFSVPVAAGKATVEVSLPRKSIAGSTVIDVRGPLHLGVAVSGSEIRFQVSEEPFRYA